MEIGLKPIVRENHFIFSSEPLAFNCPFPSSNICTVLPWSLFPLACGQNDRRSSFRIGLTEVTKPFTTTNLFCLDDMQQSVEMTMVLQCLLLWGESSFGFFPIWKIVSWYLESSQTFSLLYSVYNYVITVSVNTASSEIDLCRVRVRVKVHFACLYPVQCFSYDLNNQVAKWWFQVHLVSFTPINLCRKCLEITLNLRKKLLMWKKVLAPLWWQILGILFVWGKDPLSSHY